MNYLIDEASATGKGANTVISLLHHFFDHYTHGETSVHLHADNCSGQNKNHHVLAYLMWHVLTGRHKKITLSFLIVGHTKFSPDTCFGLIKQKYRKTSVGSLQDIATVVDNSSVVNETQLVGAQDGTPIVPMFDWGKFLDPLTKKVKRIKRFQHFRFTCDHSGKVFAKPTCDGTEKTFSLVRDDCEHTLRESFPDAIPCPGLSPERQQYLFEKIREFCPEEVQVLASVVHSIVVFIYRYKMQCVQSQHFYTQLRPTTMKIMKMMKSYLLLREGNNNYNLLAHLVLL